MSAQKQKQVMESLLKVQADRSQCSGQSSGCIEMVLLLLSHFGEKEEHLFCYVEETSLAEEIQMEDVPATPCVIVCGK